jgi:hypothetical protein
VSLNHAKPGYGNVPSYQVSGVPYVVTGSTSTSAVTTINFPYVTNDIYIRSRGTALAVGFSASGVLPSTTRFTLEDNESCTLNVRTNSIYLMATAGTVIYEVVAGLTFIHRDEAPILSASHGFSGVG